MLAAAVIAIGSATLVAQTTLPLQIGAVIAVPSALLTVCSAALSVSNDPYKYLVTPAAGYVQTAVPVVVSVIAVLPVLAAREAAHNGSSAVAAAASSGLIIALGGIAVAWGLGRRMIERVPVRS